MPAHSAGVNDHVFRSGPFHRSRLHRTPAVCRPVSRLNIDMLAPQAPRAMIRKPGAGNRRTAVFARKVFDGARKRHVATVPKLTRFARYLAPKAPHT
jgi:hypothetical protein